MNRYKEINKKELRIFLENLYEESALLIIEHGASFGIDNHSMYHVVYEDALGDSNYALLTKEDIKRIYNIDL